MKKFWSNWIYPAIEVGVIVLLFKAFLFETNKIPTSSMYPSLRIGDTFFSSKFSYGYGKNSIGYVPYTIPITQDRIWFTPPSRGDIVTFVLDNDPQHKYYIKRIIGTPGDSIQMIRGDLYINGEKVHKKLIGHYYFDNTKMDMYEEKLPNGRKYPVIYLPNTDPLSYTNDTPKFIVPDKCYFVIGDNRDFSNDSRTHQKITMLHRSNIIGKAGILFFPTFDNEFWSRIFSFIN